MAIRLINSQGTLLRICPPPKDPPNGPTTPEEWVDYIYDYSKLVVCPQSMGELPETRNTTEYGCINSNESTKSLGSIQRGNFDVEMLLDPEDQDGQWMLRKAFIGNDPVLIAVEFNDAPADTTNGTIEYFHGMVSSQTIGIAQNEAVKTTITVEVSSDITEIPAGTKV